MNMTLQDVFAIACVAASAVFVIRRTIARPLFGKGGSSCSSGCGKCSGATGPGGSAISAQPLITIRPMTARDLKR